MLRYDVAPVPSESRPAPLMTAAPLPVDFLSSGPSPRQVLAMLRAYWVWIAASAVGLAVLTAVATMAMPKTYEATAGVLISYEANDPMSGRPVAPFLAASYLATQLDLLKSRQLLLDVVDRLGWADDPERMEDYTGERGQGEPREFLAHGLAQRLDVESHADSRLVTVTYADADPAVAAQVANQLAQVYIERHGLYSRVNEQLVNELRTQLVALEARDAGLARTIGRRHPTRLGLAAERTAVRARLDAELNPDAPGQDEAPGAIARRKEHANANLASPAATPLKPAWPKPLLSIAAALLLGGMLGVAGALLREFIQRRVHCREDLERTLGLPVLVELGQPRRLRVRA